ncbi:MAG: luciferase [Brevibacillus sp.]|nr:luciferase [Brevibacillus sp.]
MRYFFNKCLHVDRRVAEAPGYRTVKSLRAGLASQFDGTQKSASQMLKDGMGWQDLIDHGFIVAGSPSTVRDIMRESLQDMRVGNVVCLFHIGSMPHWLVQKNMQLFAEEVKPHLSSIFSEWDHSQYWPKGYAQEQVEEAAVQG